MRLAPWRSDRHRLSLLLGFGPGVALLAPLIAMIMLPLLLVFHPPGVAVAMCLLCCIPEHGLRFESCSIHACRSDLLRGAEPLDRQLAAIPCRVLSGVPALVLLMLEAVTMDIVPPSARSALPIS
jgi:hypothetical protein